MIGALSIFSGLGLPAWAPRVIAGVVLVMTLLYVRGEIRDQAKLEERIETAAATSEKAGEIAEKVERIERETDVDAARAAASRKLFFAPELNRPVGEPGSGARPARSRNASADPIAAGRSGGRDRDPVTRPEGIGQAVDRDAVRRAAEAESSAGDAEQELIEVRWGTFFGLMGFGLLFISIPVVFYLGPRLGITGWVERAVSRAFYTRGHNDEQRGARSIQTATVVGGEDHRAAGTGSADTQGRQPDGEAGRSGEGADRNIDAARLSGGGRQGTEGIPQMGVSSRASGDLAAGAGPTRLQHFCAQMMRRAARGMLQGVFALLAVLIFIKIAPYVEGQFFPCAKGRSIDWQRLDDGRIHIRQAVIWKANACNYRAMSARAGKQDLEITFTKKLGNRPGGEFLLQDAYIERPLEPAPIIVRLSVQHQWNPLWVSFSHLFTLDYGGE